MARGVIALADKDWQARADLETLLEACRIKKDEKRMKAVRVEAKKRKDESVSDLGSLAEIEEKGEED
jgi:hypothetical protein